MGIWILTWLVAAMLLISVPTLTRSVTTGDRKSARYKHGVGILRMTCVMVIFLEVILARNLSS